MLNQEQFADFVADRSQDDTDRLAQRTPQELVRTAALNEGYLHMHRFGHSGAPERWFRSLGQKRGN